MSSSSRRWLGRMKRREEQRVDWELQIQLVLVLDMERRELMEITNNKTQ
jgi:hypothetical protein